MGHVRRYLVEPLPLRLRDLLDGLGEGTTECLKIDGDLLAKSLRIEPGIGLQLPELGLDIGPQNLLTTLVTLRQRCDLASNGIEFVALDRDQFSDPIADHLPQLIQGQLDLLS